MTISQRKIWICLMGLTFMTTAVHHQVMAAESRGHLSKTETLIKRGR